MNYTLLQIIPILLTMSCSGPTGLVKTQFNDWETKSFKSMDLQVELPKKTVGLKGGYFLQENTSPDAIAGLGYKEIEIHLNPVWKGDYLLEPFYLMNISIVRLTKENYLIYKAGKAGRVRLGLQEKFREDYAEFHAEIKNFKMEVPGYEGQKKSHILIIRKDYLAPNSDYILCAASLYAGSDN